MVAWLHLFVLSPVGVDNDFASTGNQLHPDEPLLISQRARVLARAARSSSIKYPSRTISPGLRSRAFSVSSLAADAGVGVGETISAAAMCSFSSTTASPLFLEQPARARRIIPDTMIRAGRKAVSRKVTAPFYTLPTNMASPPLPPFRVGTSMLPGQIGAP